MVNIYAWDAEKLRERRDSLLDADQQFHNRDAALDILIERSDISVGDMCELAGNIHRLELLSLFISSH